MLGGEGSCNRCAMEGEEELVHVLEERMLSDSSVDGCRCRCSPGGCTPFVVRMQEMQLSGDDELQIAANFTAYLKEYGNALQRRHYSAAIRFTTFQALGAAHTCTQKRSHRPREKEKLDAEDIVEIQDEYAELLGILESLVGEFEARAFESYDDAAAADAAADGLDGMITFWNGYWVSRMGEVLSELSRAGEASRCAAEDLGVVWKPQPERELHKKVKWKGWDYHFQRIEEIE
ncbi:hypothetical protein J3F83DRAFT_719343 [Trichoderma novae-zelandiae]